MTPARFLIKMQLGSDVSVSLADELNQILLSFPFEQHVNLYARIFERITILLYQESCFGLTELPVFQRQLLQSIANYSEESVVNRPMLMQREWFGGAAVGERTRDRLLLTSIVGSVMLNKKSNVETVNFFSSTSQFINSLMANDERCLNCVLALLGSAVPFKPFITLLALTFFDPNIVIDWLTSELAATSLFLRYFKLIANHPDTFRTSAMELRRDEPPLPEERKWIEQPSSDSSSIRLHIVQLEGDQLRELDLAFSTLGPKRTLITTVAHDHLFDDVIGKLVVMCRVLSTRVRRLISAGQLASKLEAIANACDRVVHVYTSH